jgi:hypothetical protein
VLTALTCVMTHLGEDRLEMATADCGV